MFGGSRAHELHGYGPGRKGMSTASAGSGSSTWLDGVVEQLNVRRYICSGMATARLGLIPLTSRLRIV